MVTEKIPRNDLEAVASPTSQMESHAIFALEGMTCASCAMRIEKGDIVSFSKGRCGPSQSREHGKSPTSVAQSIGREGVGLADTEPPQSL